MLGSSFLNTTITFQRSLRRLAVGPHRHHTTVTAASVELHYTELVPPDGNKTDRALVILHGLFGSKRNWTSLTKAFLRDLNRPVYALDLRNHGTSPHALPMTYSSMASDVVHFISKRHLTNVSLLGHSMGGKVAAAVALDPNLGASTLSHVISVDITPARGSLSNEFQSYIEVMKRIEALKVKTRKEAVEILHETEKDPSIVMFLLTNLVVPPHTSHEHAHFRIPINVLGNSIQDIGSFPYEDGERRWDGKTLFIKGAKSAYINWHNVPIAKSFFPNMVLETLDTGHWVHAERPMEFKKLVTDFIS
ncbi:alpha/beta-hydrolase [Armillaria gallica]|uniref:Alpha/beta-hydrolase n=1 Tax=Armillaria gallica TaxID=47427 RepID=A0A2H3DX29_ARMGA|nr:alpha/beta-hydrolase [Armillaria gallica]